MFYPTFTAVAVKEYLHAFMSDYNNSLIRIFTICYRYDNDYHSNSSPALVKISNNHSFVDMLPPPT